MDIRSLTGVNVASLLSARESQAFVDADVAEEVATLVKDRSSRQAGVAILAEANQLPSPTTSRHRGGWYYKF